MKWDWAQNLLKVGKELFHSRIAIYLHGTGDTPVETNPWSFKGPCIHNGYHYQKSALNGKLWKAQPWLLHCYDPFFFPTDTHSLQRRAPTHIDSISLNCQLRTQAKNEFYPWRWWKVTCNLCALGGGGRLPNLTSPTLEAAWGPAATNFSCS